MALRDLSSPKTHVYLDVVTHGLMSKNIACQFGRSNPLAKGRWIAQMWNKNSTAMTRHPRYGELWPSSPPPPFQITGR